MPSFRCKIKKLRYQGILTENETNRILDALDKAEKTAEWEFSYGHLVCTNCGFSLDDNYYAGMYCQNCGRRIRIKREEEE